MNSSHNPRQYDDPLFAGLKVGGKEKPEATANISQQRRSAVLPTLGVVFAIAMAALAYFLYQAQERIELMAAELGESKNELSVVSSQLEDSRTRISDLSEGLDESRKDLSTQSRELGRYRNLYTGLKSEQEQHLRELQALNIEKADVTEVNSLKQETSVLGTEIAEAKAGLQELGDESARNRSSIDQNKQNLELTQASLAQIEKVANQNTDEINAVKRSLEREYYNFELKEKSGYMKVFSVALSLKDADLRKQQFDLYLLADGKVLRKKDQSINEPIAFYANGQKKPFEVVVTRIDENMVVGYLSVPKS
jgi:hypothetical protein